MSKETTRLQQTAASLAEYLAEGHHYASVHLAQLIEADTKGALHPFAAELGAQIRFHLQEMNNPKVSQNRVDQLDTALYELMRKAAREWSKPKHRETTAQPQALTCQAVRVNGQTCNAPVVAGSRLCRYHLNHESDR